MLAASFSKLHLVWQNVFLPNIPYYVCMYVCYSKGKHIERGREVNGENAATSGGGKETENIFPGGSSFREASVASGAEDFDKRGQKDKRIRGRNRKSQGRLKQVMKTCESEAILHPDDVSGSLLLIVVLLHFSPLIGNKVVKFYTIKPTCRKALLPPCSSQVDVHDIHTLDGTVCEYSNKSLMGVQMLGNS